MHWKYTLPFKRANISAAVMCLIKWIAHVFIMHGPVVWENVPGVYGQPFASLNSTLEVMGKGVHVWISSFSVHMSSTNYWWINKPMLQRWHCGWPDLFWSGRPVGTSSALPSPARRSGLTSPDFTAMVCFLCAFPGTPDPLSQRPPGLEQAATPVLPQWAEVLQMAASAPHANSWQQGACQVATAAYC